MALYKLVFNFNLNSTQFSQILRGCTIKTIRYIKVHSLYVIRASTGSQVNVVVGGAGETFAAASLVHTIQSSVGEYAHVV